MLDLEDNLFGGLARNAVAARRLRNELNDLDGSAVDAGAGLDQAGDASDRSARKLKKYTLEMAVAAERDARFRKELRDQARAMLDADGAADAASRSLKGVGDGIDDAGQRARRSAPEIDRFSGRLKLLRDIAILIGPTLSPLGAATIPLLTGSLAALGTAAGGLGVTVLALKGVGDAMKALDDYQLEPTAKNLQAVRLEMEKLGPDGAHFVRYLDSIEGELRTLQLAAREGLLPGLEDGIDAALERLPQVRELVRDMAGGMGQLATSAGGDLAGGDWDEFFSMLESDGRDTLVSFGNAVGDLTNGLADLLVAFAPLNRDFAGGFEDMAQSFADWSDGLDRAEDFPEFLDYIRQNVPRALDLLGSLAMALAGIAQAAAPVGAATLPILTKLLEVIGAIAKSPLGTPFIAALAAVTAYSRAVDLAAFAQKKLTASSAQGLAAPGPLIAVAALAVAITEAADALDYAEEKVRSWEDALAAGTLTVDGMKAQIAALEDDLDTDSVGEYFKNMFDPDLQVAFFQKAFGARTELDHMKDAAALLAGEMEVLGGRTKETGDLADFFAREIGLTGDQLRLAAGDAEAFTGALAELEGWLDKRAALRGYRDAIDQVSKGLKDGFSREDLANIDAVATSIAQVASQIKDKSIRADFLAGARASLVTMAESAAPKARAEIQKVISKLDELGLTKPPQPRIGVDKSEADEKIRRIKQEFGIMNSLRTRPKIEADDSEAMRVIRRTRMELARIPDETVRINVERFGGMGGPGRDRTPGGTQPPTRVSSRLARRTQIVGDLQAAAPFAGRGQAQQAAEAKADLFSTIIYESARVGASLKDLRSRLREAERAVDRETRQRDALVSRRQEVRSAILSDLEADYFTPTEDPENIWGADAVPGGTMDPLAAAQARRDRAKRFAAAIRTLKSKGVRGTALQTIISEGLEAAEFMASQSIAYVDQFAATVAEGNQYAAAAAQAGATGVVSVAEMAEANAELKAIRRELTALRKNVKEYDDNNSKGHRDTGDRVEASVGWVSATGGRRGGS